MTAKSDIERLRNLVKTHTESAKSVDTILERMTPGERTEAQAILGRLLPFSETADMAATRQRALLDSVYMENVLRDMLANPKPRIRNGKAVTHPETGEPVPNKAHEKRVHAQIRSVLQQRSKLTGLPVKAFEPAQDGGV